VFSTRARKGNTLKMIVQDCEGGDVFEMTEEPLADAVKIWVTRKRGTDFDRSSALPPYTLLGEMDNKSAQWSLKEASCFF
jgi:hypothetical protein